MDTKERYFWDLTGHLIVPQVLSPDEVKAANDAIDHFFGSFSLCMTPSPLSSTTVKTRKTRKNTKKNAKNTKKHIENTQKSVILRLPPLSPSPSVPLPPVPLPSWTSWAS